MNALKIRIDFHCGLLLLLLPGSLCVAPVSRGQSTTNALAFTRIQVTPGQVRLGFTNLGSSVTNYALEFAPAIAPVSDWLHDTNAVLSPMGGGLYELVTPTSLALGFYRIVGFNSGQPTTANFTTPSLEVEESNGSLRLTLQFSAPFHGVVNYTVGGTVGLGDVQPLSGSVMVNGTTATILITLNDNAGISQLKYLTLTLQPGQGFGVGPQGQATINILENDAEWQGSLQLEGTTLGFVLKLLQSGGYSASLKSDGLGFFPSNEVPAGVNFTADFFIANVPNIPFPASSTLLNEAMSLSLALSALNGQTNQLVSPNEVRGTGTLTITVPGKPFLNTINQGAFLLFKPPVKPSTNEVRLVNIP